MIVAAAVRGERVFIAERTLAPTAPVPACRAPMKKTLAASETAVNAYQASQLKDQASFDRHVALENQADRDYRLCFARHVQEQPAFPQFEKQAQALVSLLQ